MESDNCIYCGAAEDTAEHTLFRCTRWDKERQVLQEEIEHKLTVDNMVSHMLSSSTGWEGVKDMVAKIMQRKEEDERIRQAQNAQENSHQED